jgi:hypothetical protein
MAIPKLLLRISTEKLSLSPCSSWMGRPRVHQRAGDLPILDFLSDVSKCWQSQVTLAESSVGDRFAFAIMSIETSAFFCESLASRGALAALDFKDGRIIGSSRRVRPAHMGTASGSGRYKPDVRPRTDRPRHPGEVASVQRAPSHRGLKIKRHLLKLAITSPP